MEEIDARTDELERAIMIAWSDARPLPGWPIDAVRHEDAMQTRLRARRRARCIATEENWRVSARTGRFGG